MPEIMAIAPQTQQVKKTPAVQERKYKCMYCARAFSRSEHRSRHERSRTLRVLSVLPASANAPCLQIQRSARSNV